MRKFTELVVLIGLLLALPTTAVGQSVIAGLVTDTTGGVLPGVTVEAASSALIEKVRVVITDGQGQYRIVDLRPGVYNITFSLAGFNTVTREGIELPANFTATVSVQLRVGALEETITVSGESPVVDVQSAVVQNVMRRETLDSIPVGRTYQAAAITTPGVTISRPDIAGSQSMFFTDPQVHGSVRQDQAIQVDGINAVDGEGRGQVYGMYRDEGDNEEVVFQTSAISAEVSQGGVRTNMIGREGGNRYSGTAFLGETPGRWQSDNFSDELRARGLTTPTTMQRVYDYNLGSGGPIMRDRIWYFSSFRYWGVDRLPADTFYPAGHPKAGERAVDDALHINASVRLTTNPTQRNKLVLYYARLPVRTIYHRGVGAGTSPEASRTQSTVLSYQTQLRWTATVNSRLLLEAGFATTYLHWRLRPQGHPSGRDFWQDVPTCCRPDQIAHTDLILGTDTHTFGRIFDGWRWRRNYVASVSYVTGSHALKTGVQYGEVFQRDVNEQNQAITQEYRNGVPASVRVWNSPADQRLRLNPDLGLYAQDSWTIRRLTLNYGLRFEHFAGYIPEQVAPAGRFVPARRFERIDDVPNWNDWAPRFSASYDVLGDTKTAIKGNVSKYMVGESVSHTARYNPMGHVSDRRTWRDLNGDDIAQDGEIGASNVLNFGVVRTNRFDPDLERPYQVEYTAAIQREVLPRMSVQAGYFRRQYYNFLKSENVLVGLDDYTPVNVISPLDGETLTVYNLNLAKRGLVDILDSTSEKNTRIYNGMDFSVDARLPNGGFVFGGLSSGKLAEVSCDVVDPNLLRFCDQREYMPFLTQYKLSGNYPLPWAGVQLGFVFQSYPGQPISSGESGGLVESGLGVTYLVNRTIVPNLTQPQVSVPLVPPGSKYLERRNQLDLRVAKRAQVGEARIDLSFDVFNALNANPVFNEVQVWGPRLGVPLEILQGRLYRVSARVNF